MKTNTENTPTEQAGEFKLAKAWVKRREWLGWYFQDQADEYADEISRVAEGKKLEMERSLYEIKRDMESLNAIEELIRVIRGLVVAAVVVGAWLWLVVPGFWLPPFMESDTTLAGWARVAWMVLSWVLAAVIGHMRFWKNYLNVLRQARMHYFWEWYSATLQFPVRSESHAELARKHVVAYEAFQTGKDIWRGTLQGGGSPEFRESKTKEALRYFDQAIANGFDTWEVFSLRGICLNTLGFYFDALDDSDKAIQKQPTRGIAAKYYERSEIKKSLFDFPGSLSDMNEAIRLSKLDNDDNRWWDKHVQKIGYNSHTEFCEESLGWIKTLIEREETRPTDKSIELRKIKRRDQMS